MGQSKLASWIEAFLNIGSGIIIAFGLSQLAAIYQDEIRMYIYSDFTWQVSATSNVIVTLVLTAVSMCRSFFWRRIFNKHHTKHLEKHYIKKAHLEEIYETSEVKQLRDAIKRSHVIALKTSKKKH